MWYEVFPSIMLVTGFLVAPQIFAYGWNRLTLNWHNEWKKWTYDEMLNRDFFVYMRDRRISGSEFVMKGLEAVPDKEEKCE